MNDDQPLLEEIFNWGGTTEDGLAYDGWQDTPPLPEPNSGEKALSWLASDRGGVIVQPPQFGGILPPRRNRKKVLAPFIKDSSVLWHQVKSLPQEDGAGQPEQPASPPPQQTPQPPTVPPRPTSQRPSPPQVSSSPLSRQETSPPPQPSTPKQPPQPETPSKDGESPQKLEVAQEDDPVVSKPHDTVKAPPQPEAPRWDSPEVIKAMRSNLSEITTNLEKNGIDHQYVSDRVHEAFSATYQYMVEQGGDTSLKALGVLADDVLKEVINEIETEKFVKPRIEKYNDPAKSTKIFSQGKVVDRRELVPFSSNSVELFTLENGWKGVFKSRLGEMVICKDIPHRTQYKREVAASQIAAILGLEKYVPFTALRREPLEDGGFEDGSIQDFVWGASVSMNSDSPYGEIEDIMACAALDYIIGNTDRHCGNILNGNVLIDNGTSYPVRYTRDTFMAFDFWEQAVINDLGIMDMRDFAGEWPKVHKALTQLGMEPQAIKLAEQRFTAITSGHYEKFGDLPLEIDDETQTVADLVFYSQRDEEGGESDWS